MKSFILIAAIGVTCMKLFLHVRDDVASTKEILRCPVALNTCALKMQPTFACCALHPFVFFYAVVENTAEKQTWDNFTSISQNIE